MQRISEQFLLRPAAPRALRLDPIALPARVGSSALPGADLTHSQSLRHRLADSAAGYDPK